MRGGGGSPAYLCRGSNRGVGSFRILAESRENSLALKSIFPRRSGGKSIVRSAEVHTVFEIHTISGFERISRKHGFSMPMRPGSNRGRSISSRRAGGTHFRRVAGGPKSQRFALLRFRAMLREGSGSKPRAGHRHRARHDHGRARVCALVSGS